MEKGGNGDPAKYHRQEDEGNPRDYADYGCNIH